jgi:hypothetical protein
MGLVKEVDQSDAAMPNSLSAIIEDRKIKGTSFTLNASVRPIRIRHQHVHASVVSWLPSGQTIEVPGASLSTRAGHETRRSDSASTRTGRSSIMPGMMKK